MTSNMTPQPSTRILVIEDDASLRRTLADRLASEGYAPNLASDGIHGLERAIADKPDAIILDLMLPGMSGFEVCRQLRMRAVLAPIIMLTARSGTSDKLSGFRLGADDYVTKPFDMGELMARLQAVLRRVRRENGNADTDAITQDTLPEVYRFGEFTLDACRMTLSKQRELLDIPTREFHVLQYLLLRRGCVVSREELLRAVWGYDITPDTRTVDTHIAWLRQRIEPNPKIPRYILTVHGEGYKFVG